MARELTSVTDVLKDLAKRHDLRIGTMSDVAKEVIALTTGNLAIDYITGVGGLPIGRITELYGQTSAGKTTTALQAAAALQNDIKINNSDEYILYLDFEHAMDGDYAAQLGLDVEHPSFLLVQPDWLEEGADIAEKLINTGKVRLAIWDSVAEMTPEHVEFGVRTNAMERARLMNSLLQRNNSLLHKYQCAGVFLNHMVEAIEMGGRPGLPPKETSPGGKALKFYASLRLAYKQIGNVKGKAADALAADITEQVIATYVKVRVTKNKIGIPFREAVARVDFGHGFDNVWSALQVLLAHKEIRKDGAWWRFDGPLARDWMVPGTNGRGSIQGEAATLEAGREHPDWGDQLIDQAVSLITEYGADTFMETDHDDLVEV